MSDQNKTTDSWLQKLFIDEVKGALNSQQSGSSGGTSYTPEKGVDYWTEEDKAEIVSETVKAVSEASVTVDTVVLSESDAYTITDDAGNVIFQADKNGIHTTQLNLKGVNVGDALNLQDKEES